MSTVIADRVRETTTTSGTGPIYFGGPVTGFVTFSSVLSNGSTTYYGIVSSTGAEWEVGSGTYVASTNSLSRDTIFASSNAGSIVSFSTGTKNVIITQPSERNVYVNDAGFVVSGNTGSNLSISNPTITTPTVTGGTFTGGTFNSPIINTPIISGGDVSFNSVTTTADTTATVSKGPFAYGTLNFTDTGIAQSAQTSVNSYFQNTIQNTSPGTASSAEFIAYNDAGTPTTNYAAFGINSSGYTGTGSISTAGYGYFVTGSTDLVLGTIGNNKIHFTVNSGATDAMLIDTSGNVVVTVNSASDALRVTQTGAGNSFVVEDATSPDPSPFVITANGSVVAGYTSTVNAGGANNPKLEVLGTTDSLSTIAAGRWSADTSPSSLYAIKSRNAVIGSSTIVQSGDQIGQVVFAADDGVTFIPAASIVAEVDATPGASDMPGRLVFKTTADGAATSTTRMTIDSSGNVGIGTSSPSTYGNFAVYTTASNTEIAAVSGGANYVTYRLQNSTNRYSMQIRTDQANAWVLRDETAGANRLFVDTSGNVGIGTASPTAVLTLKAGTATASTAPLKFTAGTNLTTPEAGVFEFDGNAFYSTDDVTGGRGFIPSVHYFRLTADGSAIGPGIANYFPGTSGVNLDPNIFYELEANLFFTKTTAGTVTFTMTFTNAPVNNEAWYTGSPVGGVGTVGAPQTAAIVKSVATAGALPATGSLTTAVNHQYQLCAMFQTNATTGGTLNIQITSSAGTVTPLTGSYFKITRLPSANSGAFV